MNRKKLMFSLFIFGLCSITGFGINNIKANAVGLGSGVDSDNGYYQLPGDTGDSCQIDFSSYQNRDLYNIRPTSGTFKNHTIHLKQPDLGGGSGTFNTLSGERVQSAIHTNGSYDFNMYYYTPVDMKFSSPGISVPENYYSRFSFQDDEAEDAGREEVWVGGRRHTKYRTNMWHFQPNTKYYYSEDKPKKYREDHETYEWWCYNGATWKGSNSNSSNIAIEPNTDDNYMGVKSTYWDDKFERCLEWRYIGYSQEGRVIGNPFFPSDRASAKGTGKNRGYIGITLQNITGEYPERDKIDTPTTYDEWDSMYNRSGKLQAIQRLMDWDKTFDSSQSMATIYTNGRKGWQEGPFSAEQWADGLSLRTNPRTETPVFKTAIGKSSYSYIYAPPVDFGDMILTEMTIYDSDDKLVGKFIRNKDTGRYDKVEYGVTERPDVIQDGLVVGNKYKVCAKVYNTSDEPLQINPALLDIGFAKNEEALKNDYIERFPGNYLTKYGEESKEQTIGGRSYATFEYTLDEIPEDANLQFRFSSIINQQHTGYKLDPNDPSQITGYTDVTDNCFETNDWAMNQFNIYHGDFVPTNIQLVDREGNEIDRDEMVPGEDYQVIWTYKYSGPNHDKPYKLYFTGAIKRYLPQGGSDEKTYPFTTTKQLKDGDVLTFNSDFVTYEIPKLYVTSTVNTNGAIGASNDDVRENKYFLNNDSSNDTMDRTWEGNWDIKISNLSVYPINDRPLKNRYITVGVKYDATLSVPEGVKNKGIEIDSTDNIKIPDPNGGHINLTTQTHLKEGINKDVTQIVEVPVKSISSGSTNVPIEVWLNYDKRKYEDDLATQDNNHEDTSMTILPPNNPNDFNTNGNKYGCPIDSSNYNSWNINHETLEFNGAKKDYNHWNIGTKYSFYFYPPDEVSGYNNEDINYTESYTIDYVKFKSKFTTDKNYGENGWVNLMDSSQAKYAKIKAGYGYELDIQVTYKNDVFGRQPEQQWSGRWANNSIHDAVTDINNGLRVSNTQTVANIHDDIYVRTEDAQIASSTGWYGTKKAFYSTVLKDTPAETVLRYQMIDKGNNDPMKIYVSEDTEDGDYDLYVYTPVYKGVGSPATKSDLCDHQELKFTVQGSMYDDNNEHIVQ